MRPTIVLLACLAAPGAAFAMDCSTVGTPAAHPARATLHVPVSPGLAAPSQLLGAQGGVLAHAYDESQSVDEVLLRLRIESCQAVATAMPAATAIDPLDPSVYKARTEFDNTPWRFDMDQNGKRMTADEFDAWMKSRGVRVARGTAPVVVPAAGVVPTADGSAAPAVPATEADPASTPPVPAPAPAPAATTPAGGNEG